MAAAARIVKDPTSTLLSTSPSKKNTQRSCSCRRHVLLMPLFRRHRRLRLDRIRSLSLQLLLLHLLLLATGVPTARSMSDDHDTTGSSADGGCVVYSGTTTATNSCDNANALEKARALQLPPVQATLGGEVEHLDFWLDNERLLLEAWNEWSASSSHHQQEFLPALDEALVINPDLYQHVHQLWEDEPTMEKEHALHHALWHEPITGVWVCRNFLTTTGLKHIRQHLQAASSAGIPTRRPNGMNRHGLVIDDETPGGVSYPQLLNFRQWLVDIYMRPIARSFFPEYSGFNEPPDDAEAYAFTVHYKVNAHHDAPEEGTLISVDAKGNTGVKNPKANTTTSSSSDIQLPEHSDASIFTLNINLNLPTNEEDYKGSILEFVVDDDETGTKRKESLRMEPGMAVLHRGMQRHQALPIQEGERHQLIVWLFGAHGYVRFVPYETHEQRTVQQRWTLPTTTSTGTTTVVAARPSLQQKPRVEKVMQSEL